MFHIILLIMKIIGIVLLCIIGLLLVTIICVLLIPIRYRIKASYHEQLKGTARIYWFFSIISFKITYINNAPNVTIKIFGIKIYDMQKKALKETGSKKKANKLIKEEMKESGEEAFETVAASLKDEVKLEETKTEELKEDEIKEEKSTENKKPSFKSIKEAIKKIRYTISTIYDKIKQIIQNIKYYIDVWNKEETQRAYSLCKTEIKKLIHHIRPRRLSGSLLFGTSDAYSTGQILAIVSMFYAVYGNHIVIRADFEHQIIQTDFKCKGRIRTLNLLVIFLKLWKNKDIRKLIYFLKREEA